MGINRSIATLVVAGLLIAGCGGGGDSAAPPADEAATAFTSPDGNINCGLELDLVRCDIAERDWEPPPAPPGCDLEFGNAISLGAGGAAELACSDDTPRAEGKPLAFGETISSGLLTCFSDRFGVTCTDAESNRGFFLSRDSYELF